MEYLVFMFLCPQGDALYTDNPKLRGWFEKLIDLISGSEQDDGPLPLP
jgi:hypothetical protein